MQRRSAARSAPRAREAGTDQHRVARGDHSRGVEMSFFAALDTGRAVLLGRARQQLVEPGVDAGAGTDHHARAFQHRGFLQPRLIVFRPLAWRYEARHDHAIGAHRLCERPQVAGGGDDSQALVLRRRWGLRLGRRRQASRNRENKDQTFHCSFHFGIIGCDRRSIQAPRPRGRSARVHRGTAFSMESSVPEWSLYAALA